MHITLYLYIGTLRFKYEYKSTDNDLSIAMLTFIYSWIDAYLLHCQYLGEMSWPKPIFWGFLYSESTMKENCISYYNNGNYRKTKAETLQSNIAEGTYGRDFSKCWYSLRCVASSIL